MKRFFLLQRIPFGMLFRGKRLKWFFRRVTGHGPSPAQPPGRNVAAILEFPKTSLQSVSALGRGAGQFPCVFKTIVILIYFKFLKLVILKWMYIPFGLTSRLEQEEELNGLRGSGTLPTADLDPSSSAASAVLCRAF